MSNDMTVPEDNYLNKILILKKKKDLREYSYIEQLIEGIESRINMLKKNGINEIYYEVPNITPGLPLYNSIEVAKKIAILLIEKGYNSVYMYENKIYIHWKGLEKKYHHIPIIIQRIQNKITNNLSKNSIVFDIPDFLPGFPLYDRYESTTIVKKYFDNQGFIVTMRNPLLHISWDLDEIERIRGMKIKFQNQNDVFNRQQQKINNIRTENYKVFGNKEKIISVNDKSVNDQSVNEISVNEISVNDQYQSTRGGVVPIDVVSKLFPTTIESGSGEEISCSVPTRLKHSKAFRNNTRTIIPIEYNDIPIKSKISFVNKIKSTRLGTYKSIKSQKNVDSIENDLEKLKMHVRDSQK